MKVPLKRAQTRWAVPVILFAVLQTSCGVPDLKPLSDATKNMADQLKSGFEQTQAVMKLAAATRKDPADFKQQTRDEKKEGPAAASACTDVDKREKFDCLSEKLDETWKPMEKAIDAVVKYSDSLVALAASAKKNQDAVTGLIDSVSGLAEGLPLAGPFGKVAGELVTLAQEMRAKKDIQGAVLKASEAVDKMAPVFKDNLNDLTKTFDAAADEWQIGVILDSKNLRDYYKLLSDEESSLRSQLLLIREYQQVDEEVKKKAAEARSKGKEDVAKRLEDHLPEARNDKLKALREAEPACIGQPIPEKCPFKPSADPDAVETRRLELVKLLDAKSAEVAILQPRYSQAVADINHVLETRQAGDKYLEKASGAIDAWQKANKGLLAGSEKLRHSPSGVIKSANKGPSNLSK
jgi:hypothetical protein